MNMRLTWWCLPLFAFAFVPHASAEKPDPNIPTPEAQVLIDQVKIAYGKLNTLKLNGKVLADIDVGGQTDKKSIDFVATYKAPGQYRHRVRDQIVTGSTGEQMYVHELTQNVYTLVDAPAQKGSYRQLPGVMGQVLEVQNPGLLLAVSGNSVSDMIEGAKKVRILAPAAGGGEVVPTLTYTAGDGRDIQLAFDPKTHMLVQAKFDLATMMRNRGAEQVNSALITIDYTDVQPDAKVDDAAFAWTPPANAREVPGSAGATDNGDHLVGKPAPDFTLNDLSGKPVKLSSLKGQVVLLDFWATWCPPCVRSLPDIAELHRAKKANVQVFAVNVGEDKRTIQSFLKSKSLDLPVLMDSDEAAFAKLGIDGIPTTLIIGVDGNVHKVFVGIPPGGKAEIERELDAAAAKPQAKAI